MLHIEKSLVDDYGAKETVSMQKVEDDIRKALEKILKMQVPANIDLNYSPVTLRQKIATHNFMLISKKQIYIAFDKEDAFYDVTRNIVHSTKIIELHENGGELFEWSWQRKR